jgi:ankyrin repeat protein
MTLQQLALVTNLSMAIYLATHGPPNRKFAQAEYANAIERALIEASSDGELARVKEYLSKGARVNARYGGTSEYFKTALSGFNWTSLIAAIEKDRFEVAEFLIANGASVQMDDGWGMTPLFALANKRTQRKEYDKLAALLLKHNADPNAAIDTYIDNPSGETALHKAVAWGHVEMVKMLIAAGANVNAQTSSGDTPLDDVYRGRNDQVIRKVLIAAGGKRGTNSKRKSLKD